jgi:hypothetical protein
VGTADGLHPVGIGAPPALRGRAVRALTRDGDGWWAILDATTLARTDRADGSGDWREVARFEGTNLHCCLPTASGLLVGASEARLFRLAGERLVEIESFRQVEGRASWFTPWGAPADVRSLSRARDETWFVNVHVGGVARSRDRGTSWTATMDIDADAHHVLAHPADPALVAAATARGLTLSRDGGDSWRFVTEGLHATYQRAVAFADGHVLASSSAGEHGRRAALYRMALARPTRLERVREGLPAWFADNVNTGCLAAVGSFVALGTGDGLVFASEDAGASWSQVAEGLPQLKCLALAGATST